ncbi:PQQ-binding-like beta-propeller repeat protein [Allokutzneria sp. A3M-2-11 16]|uniref:outer membrane protein assembly factor BamB family protein n=1 Tax=Allokutzneria sp. A3M-2-11 16 TaxID=2962043 RepID=UPI0020B7B0B3|nr:PQQ-binding-like beta-propeller repeat protein [Allokutzneria sp. A3M-2-11 16]MCP3802051.1 PQQ-binding-like beta-propeller repeat protein [Allokutzneria sp. A3M-2-11 16]
MSHTFRRVAAALAVAALAGGCSGAAPTGQPGPSSSARQLSTVPPTELGDEVASLRTSGYFTHDDATLYATTSGMDDKGVVALAIATGEQRWAIRFPDGGESRDGSEPVLVTANGRALVVHSYTARKRDQGTVAGYGYSGVLAVDAKTGEGVWNTEVLRGERFATPPGIGLVGRGSTLAASWAVKGPGSSVYHLAHRTAAALDVATGAEKWRRDNFSPRAVDGAVIAGFATGQAKPMGLDAADGRPLWSVDRWVINDELRWVAPGRVFLLGLGLTQLLDSATGAVLLDLPGNSYTHAGEAGEDVLLFRSGSTMAGYDAKTLAKLWELPDRSTRRVAPDLFGVAWRGTVYGSMTSPQSQHIALEARTGKEKVVNLSCRPTILVPGHALCGDNRLTVHPFGG